MAAKSRIVGTIASLLAVAPAACGQEVSLIAPRGIRAAIEQIIPGFERASGIKVKATFGSGLGTKRQVAQGEAFDVPIVQPPYPEVLASGNVVVDTARTLASVAVGIAVKRGMVKPDISTVEAVKNLLLGAKSVAYPDGAAGAAAGVSFADTLRRLGIATEMESRLKKAQNGTAAMAMVAKGEAEIGLTFVSEMQDPGVEVVGELPPSISTPTRLVGFVSAHARNVAAAQRLLDYLGSAAVAEIYRKVGMRAGE